MHQKAVMVVRRASSSDPDLPHESNKPAEAAAVAVTSSSSNMLAPGFRFHPTDEELVSYYLKRKVRGLPLRVDAIAEVDLYKLEPWELPSLSRLRTGDREWYFFSTLDRKYANRSRTNRATAKGYWKTTGKDRAVKHASRVVGMKKTLVFHQGRAPHGKRSNWVMHEYRLEDENLSPDQPQGSFVVCRIFEKLGSGPQNGAQYGAPFVEEEWEAAEALAPAGTFADISGDQEFLQLDDYEQKQILGDQHESTAIMVAESEGKDIGSQPEGPTFSLEEILDLDAYIDEAGLQDGANIFNNMQDNSGIREQSHSPSDQNDEYLELKDICGNVDVDSFDGLHPVDNDHVTEEALIVNTTSLEVEGRNLFFDIPNGSASTQEATQRCSPVDGIPNLQAENFLTPAAGDYASSAKLTEDNAAFYDAPSDEPPYAEDGFLNRYDLQFSPNADLSGFDMVDELMAYFDATDNNFDVMDSMENSEYVSAVIAPSDSVLKVEDNNCHTGNATLQIPGRNMEANASSAGFLLTNKQSKSVNEDYTVSPDIQSNDGWNNSLKKRVVNMLGSISAPPAMAEGSAKGKAVGLLSAKTRSSSSIRVSAGMIQIRGVTVTDPSAWALPNKRGMSSFLLSYSLSSNKFEPASKMHGGGGVFTMLLRGGLYIFGLSVLILSVGLKVGLCVYNTSKAS